MTYMFTPKIVLVNSFFFLQKTSVLKAKYNRRIFIQKNDTQHVTFTIPTQNLEPGEFTIMLGASSDDIRLTEKIVI